MQKNIGEVWDPWRLVILDPKVAVVHTKATNECWDP